MIGFGIIFSKPLCELHRSKNRYGFIKTGTFDLIINRGADLKKTIVMMLIICLAVSFCACGGESSKKGSYERVDISELDEDLELFLTYFTWYPSFSGTDIFDCSDAENCKVLGFGIKYNMYFDMYPGEPVEIMSEDPLGKFDCGAYRFGEEKTEWILKNIFNYSDKMYKQARDNCEDKYFYYYDGNYYAIGAGIGGGCVLYPLYAEKSGNRYRVWYAEYSGDGEILFEGVNYAEVEKKNIDGKDYWTLYYWSKNMPSNDGNRLAFDTDRLIGTWECNEWTYTDLLLAQGDSDASFSFDIGFYRLASFRGTAYVMSDGNTLILIDKEDGFTGMITFDTEQDMIVMHTYITPYWYRHDAIVNALLDKEFTFTKKDISGE